MSVAFEWLLPLTGVGATESGVYYRVIYVSGVVSMLVLIASWLAIAIPNFGSAGVAGAIAAMS